MEKNLLKINYFLSTWSGNRREGHISGENLAYQHIQCLKELDHNISQITIPKGMTLKVLQTSITKAKAMNICLKHLQLKTPNQENLFCYHKSKSTIEYFGDSDNPVLIATILYVKEKNCFNMPLESPF
jgi:hypothetical protein